MSNWKVCTEDSWFLRISFYHKANFQSDHLRVCYSKHCLLNSSLEIFFQEVIQWEFTFDYWSSLRVFLALHSPLPQVLLAYDPMDSLPRFLFTTKSVISAFMNRRKLTFEYFFSSWWTGKFVLKVQYFEDGRIHSWRCDFVDHSSN